ncbi:MAG: M14 family metallopeptidase [Flavobacteriaceae bacterium]
MKIYALLLGLPMWVWAQSNSNLDYYFPKKTTYNKTIPTPESVIGHQVGEWHVSHDKLVQYMYALADKSDRIAIENRGTTFEGRPLLLLVITSNNNHKNLEQLRGEHLNAINGQQSKSFDERPIIVYQGFSIHGNEPSGSNAALLLAYHLAASESEDVKTLLENSIILFDPALNPDGLQRFAHWANSNRNTNLNPDSNDREYHENWPGGRTNHYWFDMNRDWLPVQLPESKARIETFHKWMPNILTDHHEMSTNSTFFFQPGIPSRTHPLTPKLNQELTKEIGTYHAAALDQLGSLYYSEENYDDFYYGKGSTFPDVNGSIGILFEQASSRGHVQESDNGILTFPFTIRNQLTAGISTLKAALAMRTKILKYQFDFFQNTTLDLKSESGQAYIFGDANDPAKTYHLAEILDRHQIDLYQLKEDKTIDGQLYKKESTYVVPKQQRNGRLLKAMFETRTRFQDSLFYDISAWSFPLAFDVNYTSSGKTKYASDKIHPTPPKGKLDIKSNYAYLMPWSDYYSPRALQSLLSNGIRVKAALQPFSSGGRKFDYGTILIPVQNQILTAKKLAVYLDELAQKNHLNIYGINSGATTGPDLGSNNFKTLKIPSIALIVGAGIDAYDAGEIWHLMDTRYEIPITKLDVSYLERTDLNRYDCIILPNTYGLNNSTAKKLEKWLDNGGTLIAYQNALKWLKSNTLFEMELNTQKLVAENISFEDRSKFRGAQGIGGAIFEANLDRSHPINFGYHKDNIALFRNTTIFIKPDKNSYNNPIKYTDDPLLSGYVSKENLELIKNSVPFKLSQNGKGKIIGFTDNTNFRAFWYGTNKLLMNAVFFRNQF